jgi:hypothetical protein
MILGAVVNNEKHTLGGDVTVYDAKGGWTMDAGCATRAGYDDITIGAPVVVRDGNGKVIGIGSIGASVADAENICVFPINVPKVPQVDFYSVVVGHRDPVTMSKAELSRDNWQIELTLGSP